jgi:chromate transporter
MEILKLALVFLKIGAVSFGGGWTIVGLLRDEVTRAGLMGGADFEQAVAIAQITPGPVALNVATLAGWRTAGWLGSLAATMAVLAVPIALLAGVAFLARRVSPRKEALAEALSVGALSMTVMTAANLLAGGWPDIRFLAIAAASFALNAFTKINPALIIVSSGLLAVAWDAAIKLIAR